MDGEYKFTNDNGWVINHPGVIGAVRKDDTYVGSLHYDLSTNKLYIKTTLLGGENTAYITSIEELKREAVKWLLRKKNEK